MVVGRSAMGPARHATRTRRARRRPLALAQLAEGGPPFMKSGALIARSSAGTHADCSARGGTEVLRALAALSTIVLRAGAPPHADARYLTSAPPHRVRIDVVPFSLMLDTMRLLIDMAGGSWELRMLSRSAGRLAPALGFFSIAVLLVVDVYLVLALVVARFAQRPAHLCHQGPGWQEDGAARRVRAALPIDDLVQAHPVAKSRPSSARCTASSLFVQVAVRALAAVLLPRPTRATVETLHNRDGTEFNCFSALRVASSQMKGGGRRRKVRHELKDMNGAMRRGEGEMAASASTARSTSRNSADEAVGAAVILLASVSARASTASMRKKVKVGVPDLLLAASFVGTSTLTRSSMRQEVVGVPSCLLVSTSAGTPTAPVALARDAQARLWTPCVARCLLSTR